nr:stage II sporulation protein P [Fredinandcohnia sp. SECRCQ15]
MQIDYRDIRSFIGKELPGFTAYRSQKNNGIGAVESQQLPYESVPPLEELLQEREMAQKELEELTKSEPDPPLTDPPTTKKVLIYHSHSFESFLPLLGLADNQDGNKAVDSKTNITIVGELLGKGLEKKGIGVMVDKTNIGKKLKEKGWGTTRSYDISRTVVQEVIANHTNIDYLIDIHRDSARKEKTTVTINEKPYAKLYFIVGKASKNYEKNYALATSINKSIEAQYPGVSRGVWPKGKEDGNGNYNQDLSENSILIEVGGVDNDMKELKNTVDALSKVISDYFWNAEKVNNDG